MKAPIDWYICRADHSDVEYGRSLPKSTDPDYRDLKKAGKHKEPRSPSMKVNDEMWRVPISIGPIATDHDHWAGWHLTCTPAQAERISYLIENDPDFPAEQGE